MSKRPDYEERFRLLEERLGTLMVIVDQLTNELQSARSVAPSAPPWLLKDRAASESPETEFENIGPALDFADAGELLGPTRRTFTWFKACCDACLTLSTRDCTRKKCGC